MRAFILKFAFLLAAFMAAGSEGEAQTLALKKGAVVIVRHAEKEKGNDPGLTPEGMKRGHDLAKWLVVNKIKITNVFVSQYRRTRQTSDGVVSVFKPEVFQYKADESGEGFAKEFRSKAIEKGNILVVGHSNTLPGILKQFGIDYPGEIPETEYDNLFLLRFKKGKVKFSHLRYGYPNSLKQDAVKEKISD